MAINKKITTTAVLIAASFAFGSAANADVCDTPSKLGDMGSFPGKLPISPNFCLLYTSDAADE